MYVFFLEASLRGNVLFVFLGFVAAIILDGMGDGSGGWVGERWEREQYWERKKRERERRAYIGIHLHIKNTYIYISVHCTSEGLSTSFSFFVQTKLPPSLSDNSRFISTYVYSFCHTFLVMRPVSAQREPAATRYVAPKRDDNLV